MSEQGYEQLTLSVGGSPVNRSPLPGSAEARRMTVSSGRKCSELSEKSGPLGLLAKMLLESSAWHSTMCYLTWKPKATPRKRLYFQLRASAPRTGEIGHVLWVGTPEAANANHNIRSKRFRSKTLNPVEFVQMWPTPTAMDAKDSMATHLRADATPTRSILLSQKIAMWPTPKARDWKGGLGTDKERQHHDLDKIVLLDAPNGGQLNPDWVEWLMNFPIGWTNLTSQE